MKELHLITSRGCDLYPNDSLHLVEIKQGRRTTNNGTDSINTDIKSTWIVPMINSDKTKECLVCRNTFLNTAKFHTEIECIRCHERKTKLNRD